MQLMPIFGADSLFILLDRGSNIQKKDVDVDVWRAAPLKICHFEYFAALFEAFPSRILFSTISPFYF